MIIITTVASVLKELTTQIATKVPDMKKVYNPELTYDEGIKLLRGNVDFEELISNAGETPIFMFNRTALKRTETFGRRMKQAPVVKDNDAGTAKEYKSDFLEFEFRFLYVTPSLRNLEQFEMGYMVGDGIKDLKDFELDLTEFSIDPFKYQVDWKPLEDIQVMVQDKYYKGLGGFAKVSGNFLIETGSTKLITEINLLVKDWLDVTLDTIQIVPA